MTTVRQGVVFEDTAQTVRFHALNLAVSSTSSDWDTDSLLRRADAFESFLADGSIE